MNRFDRFEQALAERAEDTSDSVAYDIRLDLAPYSKLPWLNNMDKDKRLGSGGRSVTTLLQASGRALGAGVGEPCERGSRTPAGRTLAGPISQTAAPRPSRRQPASQTSCLTQGAATALNRTHPQMYPGRLHPLGVNIFNVIYIGDPTSHQGLAMGRIFKRIHERCGRPRAASAGRGQRRAGGTAAWQRGAVTVMV